MPLVSEHPAVACVIAQCACQRRLGGAHGIRKYCRSQAVTATRLTPRSELLWYPYTALKSNLFLRLTRLLFARDWGRRLRRRTRKATHAVRQPRLSSSARPPGRLSLSRFARLAGAPVPGSVSSAGPLTDEPCFR